MPNLTGGKNYKKSKHSSATEPKYEEAKGGDGEMYGRVVKLLGNLNMLVYCQDNYVRICKVRGSMRKRCFVNLGDLVIISLREYVTADDEEERKGDIVYKYDPTLHSKLKKVEAINQRLFLKLETMDIKDLKEFSTKKYEELIQDENDVGIVFESDSEEDGEGKNDEEKEKSKREKTKKQVKESKQAKQTMEDDGNEEINIDDI